MLDSLRDLSLQVPIDTKLLLFGSNILTDCNNVKLFKVVYKFIEGSKRF